METEFKDRRCDRCKEIEAGIQHEKFGPLDEVLMCSVCGDAAKRYRKYLYWKKAKDDEKYDELFG